MKDATDCAQERLDKLNSALDQYYSKLGRRCKTLAAYDKEDADTRLLLVNIESRERTVALVRVCGGCGKALADKDVFCKHCGKRNPPEDERRCGVCGAILEEDAKFCALCGAKVPSKEKVYCSKCGALMEDNARFCGSCGAPVEAVTECPKTPEEEEQE